MSRPLIDRPIQLVAFDLDGTLVGRDLRISSQVRTAVAHMKSKGIAGCLVTGRMYRATLPFARELALDGPIVCYQGAAIVDPVDDVVLYDRPLDNALVLEIIALAADAGMHLQLYRNEEYYVQARNEYTALYASVSRVEPVVVPSLREAFAYSQATKAVVVARDDVARAYVRRFGEHFDGRAYVTRSLPEFVEILHPQVNKGDALAFVARRLQIPIEATLAIGDSWNDAPLLRAAAFGVAMGSAPPELLEVADAVVADVATDGVAQALERFVLA